MVQTCGKHHNLAIFLSECALSEFCIHPFSLRPTYMYVWHIWCQFYPSGMSPFKHWFFIIFKLLLRCPLIYFHRQRSKNLNCQDPVRSVAWLHFVSHLLSNLITDTRWSLHRASEENNMNSLILLFQLPVLQTEDGNLLNSANSICRFKFDVFTTC